MSRANNIENEIKKLEAQLEYWRAELVIAKKQDADDDVIFEKTPRLIQNRFEDLRELMRFIYGQHTGYGIPGCRLQVYDKAETPYERLRTINGVGNKTALETLEALQIE